MEEQMPDVVKEWIRQITSDDVLRLVREVGSKRRLDFTLYADRGHVSKPPSYHVS